VGLNKKLDIIILSFIFITVTEGYSGDKGESRGGRRAIGFGGH